ncbi:MAG TPA: hypothetical protein VJ770_22870 [Stellaceae bacterium]|nr:hypothetical protein [Stellaceae bacterium]
MTDNPITPGTPDSGYFQYLAEERAYAERNEGLRPANKTALFEALASSGITSVLVRFDGEGDNGQIEEIDAVCGEAPAELPSGEIELAEPVWGSTEIRRTTLSVSDAIETLAYNLLEETHGGWENGDGAWGDFTFDVAARSITLAYNERHMESDYSEHVF